MQFQLLWEQERKETGEERKQSFVDLGCGNGLLVYLLSKEGVGDEEVGVARAEVYAFVCTCSILVEGWIYEREELGGCTGSLLHYRCACVWLLILF